MWIFGIVVVISFENDVSLIMGCYFPTKKTNGFKSALLDLLENMILKSFFRILAEDKGEAGSWEDQLKQAGQDP